MHYTHHYLDQGLERWIYTTAKRNYWRVSSWYDFEDLVQEGYLCFFKCVDRYQRLNRKRKPRKDDRRNFMALVRTTYLRHITDLANSCTEQRVEQCVSQLHRPEITAETWLEQYGKVTIDGGADLAILLSNAPREIKQLIDILTNDTAKTIEYVRIKKGKYHFRESTNEHFCRLLDLDPKKVDMVEIIQQYFRASQPA